MLSMNTYMHFCAQFKRNSLNIVSILVWLRTGFGLVNGFTGHLQNVPANNYDSLTELHTQ
jgi:hypothetical protein